MWDKLQILQRRHTDIPTLYPAAVKTTSGTKWGYINEHGHFIIAPQYDYAADFQSNGLAVVNLRDSSGVINRQGKFVVPPTYGSISQFSEGRASASRDQGMQVIDETGRVLTSKLYSYIGSYQDGRAQFANTSANGDYHYGYLDLQGMEVIPAQFQSASDFHDGKAVVQIKKNEYALIGLRGERLQTYPFGFVGQLRDGMLAFQKSSNDPYGYIDEKGNVKVSPQYSSAQDFSEGRAVVNASKDFTQNLYGLIEKQGRYIVKPEYNDILQLGQERIAVGKVRDKQRPYMGSTYAIADNNGHFLSEFAYNQVEHYHDDYASATNNQMTFFIDKKGKMVKNMPIVRGSGTLTLKGNVVQANVNQRVSYYTRSGQVIYKENTTIPLTHQLRILEKEYYPNKDYFVYYPQVEGMKNNAAQEKLNRQLAQLSQVKPIDPTAQLDYSYSGDFSVEFFKKRLVVIELTGYNFPFGAAHGMPSQIYVNADLTSGVIYQLKDLFTPNSNYVQVLSNIVGYQIQHDPQYSYVFPGAYTGIKPDQPFYVKENALYLYFYPYDIAPYAAGFPTFTIPFKEIMNIIDVNGSFWRSFHTSE